MEHKNGLSKDTNLTANFISTQNQVEIRMWIDAMSSYLDDILRNNYDKSIPDFADTIIYEISKITNATRGVFYVLEEKSLKAIGCYACTSNSLYKNSFELGEGIIGQVAKGKETVYLDNLLPNNLEVSTASGNILANSVIVIPLVFNNNIFGVLELLYINSLENKHKELLKKLGGNIATMLQSIQGNIKTKLLLADTMQQANILQTIEEELRQNMEELQTTQEEMQRLNKEMSLLNKAVEESLFVIEILPNGIIIRACDLFLQHIGYSAQELIDVPYSHLWTEYDDNEFIKMLVSLQEGNVISKEIQRKKKNGDMFWLYATYYAVTNEKGQMKKVIKFAYDITERIENQKFVEANENLLKERTKSIQEKAYKQIKDIRAKYEAQLAEKDAIILELSKSKV